MPTTAEAIEAKAAELGLTMEAKFIPWSQSRYAGEEPCLNWKVTLIRAGRRVVTTDYMAGSDHCPSYKQGDRSERQAEIIKAECEKGRKLWKSADSSPLGVDTFTAPAILPKFSNVLYSLVSDASAIDYSGFEEWATGLGYDTDSRKAEAVYRACLDIGLKLRNALGEAKLAELRQVCADY